MIDSYKEWDTMLYKQLGGHGWDTHDRSDVIDLVRALRKVARAALAVAKRGETMTWQPDVIIPLMFMVTLQEALDALPAWVLEA